MPRDENGTFSRVSNSFSEPIIGDIISPTDAATFFDDLDEALDVASQSAAETGVDNTTIMSPLRTKQALLNGAFFTQTGTGAVARTFTDKVKDVISLKDFGAVGDGAADDTVAINNWLAVVATGKAGFAPAGTYKFTSALSCAASGISIQGAGRRATTFKYAGAATNIDLITFGDGSNNYFDCRYADFKIDSSTTMTAGAALRIRRHGRTRLNDVVVFDEGSNTLWDCIRFDQFGGIYVTGFFAKGQNEGLVINGGAEFGGAGCFLSNGHIQNCVTGVHVGGGAGGVQLTSGVDVASNTTGLLIDTALYAVSNREIYATAQASFDVNGTGIDINDTLATGAGAIISLDDIWSSSSTSGPNINIRSGVKYLVQITGGRIYNGASDGIKNSSTNVVLAIVGADIRSNGGWGINNSVSNANVTASVPIFASNTSGNFTGLLAPVSFYDSSGNLFIGTSSSSSAVKIRSTDGNVSFGGSGGSDRRLTLEGNATGATACYGARNVQTVQSDVTSSFNVFATAPSTVAASFTMTDLNHFLAQLNSKGAGSTITNQTGFHAGLSLTGATNNYGFRNSIAAASGCWGFYSDSAVENYFAGPFAWAPGASATPANNGDIKFEFPTNTTVNIKGKGSDATVRTATVPLVNDTLVGKATTDTLTNKTFDTAGTGNSFSINGVAATANTGTGAVARAASPTFTGTLGAAAIAASGSVTAQNGTAIPAGGTAGAGLLVSSTANFGVFFGSGAPSLSAAKGSLYLRSDGSATNNRAYINTDGSTTWTPLTTGA